MSDKFEFPPVTRADGSAVETETLTAPAPEPVRFNYLGYIGLTVFCDPTKADTAALLDFRAAVAREQKYQLDESVDEEESDEIFKLADQIEGKLVADARKLIGDEAFRRVNKYFVRTQLDESISAETLDPLRAKIVAPCIVAHNIPGVPSPLTADVLLSNATLMACLLPALWRWYRPFMTGSVATSVTESGANGETTGTNAPSAATVNALLSSTPLAKDNSPSGASSTSRRKK